LILVAQDEDEAGHEGRKRGKRKMKLSGKI
jgi:hypothetical protein